ncbi:selenocysteine-specific translation elongation factor [Alteribacillus sp. YIM 98480]|uniref:selenocysteine-specific translation elongation factor n=1 Tax=Alteribacillus sp. YIM 98480 TaxID=2606599 RepID=UPI00131D343B|nr:selenocysteine-specific translation elongation factor [Alteribacillus sp. YIM 98480]
MGKRTLTIGMAGHIDHGKTTLTKALTKIDTDRLKEEKERNISIEPGFAPLQLTDDLDVSIIDVPGHERFIRQMIAGVAGIDAVVLTVAADEGVMPQTKEHLDILSLLDVKGGLIAVTKADKVDDDLLELAGEDIREEVKGTPFEKAEMVFVDSLTGRGVEEVREQLIYILEKIPVRDKKGAFRLPIDQVFTVHGQGTVVRGTVYEGSIFEGDTVQVLPKRKKTKIRQLQIHGSQVQEGVAGQRLAMNLSGVSKEEIRRGDVVVAAEHYVTTSIVHVVLFTSKEFFYALKQRGYIKLHLGTAEVYGNIVFFDRNVLEPGVQKVVCQLRLDKPVVTKREDRFILRRPTPTETIGGGWIINPQGERLPFGEKSVQRLEKELEGTPDEHIKSALLEEKWLTREDIAKQTGLTKEDVNELVTQLLENSSIWELSNKKLVLKETYEQFWEELIDELKDYHEMYPLRTGKNKEELQSLKSRSLPKELIERFLEEAETENKIKKHKQYVSLHSFVPYYPKGWEKRMQQLLENWRKDGISVKTWDEYAKEQQLPKELSEELKWSLMHQEEAVGMDDKHIWSLQAADEAAQKLRVHHPASFTLQEAKEVLRLTRKYLVPLLEWMDESGRTKRIDQERVWRN